MAIPGYANSVAVNGPYAYVAAGSAGLQIVSVSNHEAATLVSSLNLNGNANDVTVVGTKVYVAAGSGGLAVADISNPLAPTLAGTAQLALQQAHLVARNVKSFIAGDPLHTKHFEELGEAVSLGTERAAVLAGGKVFGGPLARQARFAMYTSRLPTWHHRLRVGASWFFEGTAPRPLLPLGIQR